MFGIGYHLTYENEVSYYCSKTLSSEHISSRIETSAHQKEAVENLENIVLTNIQGSELEKVVNQKYYSFLLPKSQSYKFPSLLNEIKKLTEKRMLVSDFISF